MLKNNRFNLYIAILILTSFFMEQGACFAALSQKTIEIAREVINNPTQGNVSLYVKAMLKEYKKAYKENNLEEASDDLRSALYFLKDKPNSTEYNDTLSKLNSINEQMGVDLSDENRLEIAKNLYLENKIFASAYEFSVLLKEGYETDVCYEYMGNIAQKLNMQDTAFALYKKAVEENPENINAKYKYANFLLQKGEITDAILYFEDVVENTNSKPVIDDIIKTFTQRLNNNPDDENNYGILGLAYQKLGQYDKTYKLLKKSLIINPKDIFLRYYLGNLLFNIHEYSFADEIYTEILEENPYESQIRISRAKAYIQLNQVDKAIKDYQIVLAMYPESLQAQYGMYSLLKNKYSLDEIVKLFYPIDSDYKLKDEDFNSLGYFANKIGATKDAIVFFQKALLMNPKSETPYIELYKIYQLLGQNDKAKEIIQKGYKALPKNGEINQMYSALNSDKINEKYDIALSYLNSGEFEKAIAVYNQIEPKNTEVYQAIGNCYRQLGDFKNAISNYKKSIELSPDDSDAYYALGVAYLESNNQTKAKDAFKLSVQKDSKNLKSKKMLSYIEQKEVGKTLDIAYDYFEKKNYAQALKYLNSASETFPNDPKVFFYRGLTKEATGDIEGAVSDFKTTVKIDRNYFIAYYKLGENLEKIHKEKEALYMYEKFLGAENIDEALAKIAQQRVIELGEKYY